MHEIGITQNIIDIAEENARQKNAARILSLRVEIGALSGVVPEAVEFAFDACSAGTLAENATLIIDKIPGRGRCTECGAECDMDKYSLACPKCNAFGLEIVQGEELSLKEMEID